MSHTLTRIYIYIYKCVCVCVCVCVCNLALNRRQGLICHQKATYVYMRFVPKVKSLTKILDLSNNSHLCIGVIFLWASILFFLNHKDYCVAIAKIFQLWVLFFGEAKNF